jgi:hypothetical protein
VRDLRLPPKVKKAHDIHARGAIADGAVEPSSGWIDDATNPKKGLVLTGGSECADAVC